jgi:hypothetical protein
MLNTTSVGEGAAVEGTYRDLCIKEDGLPPAADVRCAFATEVALLLMLVLEVGQDLRKRIGRLR